MNSTIHAAFTQAGDASDRHFFHRVLHALQTQDCASLTRCLDQGFNVYTRFPTFRLPKDCIGRCYDVVGQNHRDLRDDHARPTGLLVLVSWTYNLDVSYYYATSYWYCTHWLSLESTQWCKLNECNNPAFRATCRRSYNEICDFYRAAQHPEQEPEQEQEEEFVTALHVASTNDLFIDFVRTLLDHGADVNATSSKTRLSALHLAARLGQSKVCRLLLERGAGASLSVQTIDGLTPWHLATQQRHGKVLEVFQAYVESRVSVDMSLVSRMRPRSEINLYQLSSLPNSSSKTNGTGSSHYNTDVLDVCPLLMALEEMPLFEFDGAHSQELTADLERRVTNRRALHQFLKQRGHNRRAEMARLEDFVAHQQQVNRMLQHQQKIMQHQLEALQSHLRESSRQPHGQQSIEQDYQVTDIVKRFAPIQSYSIQPLHPLDDGFVVEFSLKHLREITNGFCEKLHISSNCFGSLYAARDHTLAVKVLSNHLSEPLRASCQVLTRFADHPNVLRLRGYLEQANRQVMLVYEFSTKGTIAQVLQNDTEAMEFTWQHRVKAVHGLCDALAFMHGHVGDKENQQQFFHGDVRSGNVLLTELYESKLMDCGLANLVNSERFEGRTKSSIPCLTFANALGTAGYLCPRYCRTLEFNAKTEIYALGVTMLEVVTGRVQNDQGVDLMALFVEEPDHENSLECAFDTRAGQWPSSVVTSLARLIRECTYSSREYARRLATMEEVLTPLKALEAQLDFDIPVSTTKK